jgi:hypothetical protein
MDNVITYILVAFILLGWLAAFYLHAPRKAPDEKTQPVLPWPIVGRTCDITGCTELARHFFAAVTTHPDVLLAVCDEHADGARLWVGKNSELLGSFNPGCDDPRVSK